MDTDSDRDSYGTEPTVFDSDADSDTDNDADSNADSNANSNGDADCDADSSINCNADSITKSNNACKAPAQVWLHEDQDYLLEYYLK